METIPTNRWKGELFFNIPIYSSMLVFQAGSWTSVFEVYVRMFLPETSAVRDWQVRGAAKYQAIGHRSAKYQGSATNSTRPQVGTPDMMGHHRTHHVPRPACARGRAS